MCTANSNVSNEKVYNNDKFTVNTRKEYCVVKSLDFTTTFVAMYMRMRFFLNAGPMVASSSEEVEHLRGLMNHEVVPFLKEMDKALGLD